MTRLRQVYVGMWLLVGLMVPPTAWIVAAALPANWLWFGPGPVVVADSVDGAPPAVSFSRTIYRDTVMMYHVVTRDLAARRVVCEGGGGPFTYRASATLPERIDLTWWSAGECWPLPTGTYIAETCWTVTRPFWGMVPAKTVCRESNPFTVVEVAR